MEPEDIERLKRRITEEEEKRKKEQKELEKKEKKQKEKELQKEARKHMARGEGTAGGIADIILYAGVLYIGYKVLTEWGVISSTTKYSNMEWTPLTNEQIELIRT